MVKDIQSDARKQMDKTIEALRHEMSTVRTGRARSSMLDPIRVEYYGSIVPINQVASIAVPEARLLTIQPYDKSSLPAIEKAIQSSNLGLTPSNDGQIIRLPVPQLTEERRKELVKVVRQMAEEGRVSIRNHRRHANDLVKEGQKEGEIPEDDAKRGQEQIQKLTDEYIGKIDEMAKAKEEEIMEL